MLDLQRVALSNVDKQKKSEGSTASLTSGFKLAFYLSWGKSDAERFGN